MILVLARTRPELRWLGWLGLFALVQGALMAWVLSKTGAHVYPLSTLDFMHGPWLVGMAMPAIFALRELRSRWEPFERSLPVAAGDIARAQLLAMLGVTCLPPAMGLGLACLLSQGGLPRDFPWVCLTFLGGLALFATSLLAWQRPGVRFPVRGIVQGTLLLAGALLVARHGSARLAALLALGAAVAASAFLWWREDGAVASVPRGSLRGATFRQRFATPALLVFLAFYASRLDTTGDFFLLFLLFFQDLAMRTELAPVRALGYLPLARRARAARAVLLPLLALVAGSIVLVRWAPWTIEWGHREPRVERRHVEGQGWLDVRPSSMLWELHLGSEAPLVTRPDGSTFRQQLVPVVPGLSLRNPYEVGPGASEAFLMQRVTELGRDLYGVELAREELERRLVRRGLTGLEPYHLGRFPHAFSDLPRLDFRYRALGTLALCVLLWALAVRSALLLPSWPLLARRSLLAKLGASRMGARPARFLFRCAVGLFLVVMLTAFHDGLQLASQVLLHRVGALLAQPAGALVALTLVGLYAARAIRHVDRMDAVPIPLDATPA